MAKLLLTVVYGLVGVVMAYGQDSLSFLNISGSVDVYYKYDLAGFEDEQGHGNIGTSFANNQNSASIGMANLILSQEWDKVGFVADVSFGPRGQSESLLNGADGNSFHIQNLLVHYSPADKLTLTAGFMGTFIGYEVISPAANFHYSTSYLFSGGPFQNAGITATYAFSEKVSLMAGLFNDWNEYQDGNGMTDFGAQLAITPADGYEMYFNFLQSDLAGTTLDVVSSLQLAPSWTTGINIAHHRNGETVTDYTGFALYQTWGLGENFDLGFRGEWFKYYNQESEGNPGGVDGPRMLSATLSANINVGSLTFIPEWRMDFADSEIFIDGSGDATKSAGQFLIAAVYAF